MKQLCIAVMKNMEMNLWSIIGCLSSDPFMPRSRSNETAKHFYQCMLIGVGEKWKVILVISERFVPPK
jgi:hypothetical protein